MIQFKVVPTFGEPQTLRKGTDAPLKALFQPRFERLRRPPLGRFKRKIVAVRR